MTDFTAMADFVKDTLRVADNEPERRLRTISSHTMRVFSWAERISDEAYDVDREALLIAALFHDVGYAAGSVDGHAMNGVPLWRQYAFKHNLDSDQTIFVSYLIGNHSKKELLSVRSTPIELVMLMEADLLDQEGARAIVRDCLLEGAGAAPSFETTLQCIKESSGRLLESNPLVTPKARDYWREKQNLTREFIAQLMLDLG